MGRVASIRFGRVPCQLVLLLLRSREEGGGVGEDFGQSWGGDGVVFEVDEAGFLEAGEEGGGYGSLLRGAAMQIFGEVYELRRMWGQLVGRSRSGMQITGMKRLSCSTADSVSAAIIALMIQE